MTKVFVGKIDCPRCGGHESLNMWEEDGERTGYCFRESHDENSQGSKYFSTQALSEIPESDVPYIEKEPANLDWIQELATKDNPTRGLKAGAYRHFGIKHGLSTADGRTIAETYYPRRQGAEVKSYKVRVHNPKEFFCMGSSRGCDPFGWREALEVGGYTLYVTEGEEDAVALYTAWMRVKKQKVAVVSLNQGTNSTIKTLQPILPDIMSKFKQVVYAGDMDSAGDTGTRDIRALFPSEYTVKVATYTENDANAMVLAGKEQELVQACYNASSPLAQGVIRPTEDMFDSIKQAPEFGYSYPWPTLTKLTRGERKGEVYYWGAPPKQGKSTIVNLLGMHNVRQHNRRILLIKPEEQPENTLRRFAGAIVGKVFHDPEVVVNPDDVDKAQGLIGDRVHILDRWQSIRWEDTRQLIREEVLGQGTEVVYIDPLTNFTVGMNGSERNDFLISMTRELSEDAANYGFTAHVFCHLNTAPKGDRQWNQGRVPTSDDFQGSRAMAQACHMMIGIQGWKLTEGDDKDFFNSQRVLHILEEREYGVSDSIPLQWYSSKGLLLEKNDD